MQITCISTQNLITHHAFPSLKYYNPISPCPAKLATGGMKVQGYINEAVLDFYLCNKYFTFIKNHNRVFLNCKP